MATVTSNPSDTSITSTRSTTSTTGTISWNLPSVPSNATITSCVLSGTVQVSSTSSISKVTVNGTDVSRSTSGTSFSVNLGTTNVSSATVVVTHSSSSWSTYTTTFSNMTYTVTYEGGSGGGSTGGEVRTITLRPISASGSSWSNIARIYDGDTSNYASISATSSNYSSRVATCNFDISVIPSGATINSATLSIMYKQSSSTSSRRYTPYIDINGSSSNRVISSQLTSTSTITNTADVKNYMSNLSTITITPYRAGTSGSNTLNVYEMWIDIQYIEPVITTKTQLINIGTSVIKGMYLGNTTISRIYIGDTLIFES